MRTPAGEVLLDPSGRAPGRGAYVCADPACHQLAITKGALRRALEAPVPAGLFGSLADAAASPTTPITDHEGGA